MRTSFPGEKPSAPVGAHLLAKLKAHRQYARSAPGGLGSYPLKTARGRHRTGTPAHVKAWREAADAGLALNAQAMGIHENPRIRLAFATGRWTWARRLIWAEMDRIRQAQAGKVPF